MAGEIVKLKSGKLGILYWGKHYAYVKDPTRTPPYPALALVSDPIEETFPPTKTSTLSVAEVMARVSSPIGHSSGTDPEVFVFAPDGTVIPAWQFLPAKDKPLLTHRETYDPTLVPQVSSYWDGVQAEVTLSKGETCHAQLVDSVRYGLVEIWKAAQKHTPGAYLECKDVVKLDDRTLMEADEVHVALGCSPSQNAYKNVNPISIADPRTHPIRYSGCHLHYRVQDAGVLNGRQLYGGNMAATVNTPEYPTIPEWFPGGTIKMFDRVLGLLLTALGRDLEDPVRRQAYGRPGEYRQTANTGIEYRTPGAFLLSSPAVLNFALDMGRRAFGLGLLYNPETFFLPGAKDIIMNCDADEAVKRIEKFAPFFESLFFNNNNWDPKGTMEILRKGLKAHGLVKPMLEAWKLDKGGTHSNDGWIQHNNQDRADWKALSRAAAARIAVPANAPAVIVPQAVAA